MISEPGHFVKSSDRSTDVAPEVQQWFALVDLNKSGSINSRELQIALLNGPEKTFSEESCHLLIALFDRDKTGTIDLGEFQHLYVYIQQWTDVFRSYDKNDSGYIEGQELEDALRQMGYRLSSAFVNLVVENCGDQGKRLALEQFIVVCVKMQRLTNAFRAKDREMKGVASFSFDDFLTVVLEDFL